MQDKLNIKKWNPERCRTNDVFRGEPLSNPVKFQTLHNGSQQIKLASIKKKNLFYDPFQRPIEQSRVDGMSGENFDPDFGVANVVEMEYGGHYYYTIIDGQHRSEANPEDSVGCIISNHAPPVTKFVKANKNMKNISKDDELWALYHGFNPEARWLFQTLRANGLEPSRNSGDEGKKNRASGKFVGAAKLYDVYNRIRTSFVNKKYKKEDEETKTQITKQLFERICGIMIDSYGAHTFYASDSPIHRTQSVKAYRDIWMGMIQYLNTKSWQVDDNDIKAALSVGCYGAKQPMGETFESINDLARLCKMKFINHFAGNESKRQEGYSKVIKNMVNCYVKHIKPKV